MIRLLLLGWFVASVILAQPSSAPFDSAWPTTADRHWIGPEFWGNTLADWRLRDGRVECVPNGAALRTLHLLTRSLAEGEGSLSMSVDLGALAEADPAATGGFLIGAGPAEMDYRGRAIVFGNSGKNGGLIAGVNGSGDLVVLDNEAALERLPLRLSGGGASSLSGDRALTLRVEIEPSGAAYRLGLALQDGQGAELQRGELDGISAERLTGNLALVSHPGAKGSETSFWFRDWHVAGAKAAVNDQATFGPVLGALYTVSRGVLKLTAQMAAVGGSDPKSVRLEVRPASGGQWRAAAEASIVVPGYTATFRVTDWDATAEYDYRVAYRLRNKDHFYYGIIRREPTDRDNLVVAAFTGNLNLFATLSAGRDVDFTEAIIFFPHRDIIRSVQQHRPDLLVYTGDQIYEHRPQNPDRSGAETSFLDYYYKWSMFLWAHGELTRNTPAVSIPDDHDVFHINLWGAGGRKSRQLPADGNYPPQYTRTHFYPHDAGYILPASFVNMVERTQTSHLPDPYDPTPVEQGIGVYYTDLLYAGISFAVLEDRKFKSSPVWAVPEAKTVNGFVTASGIDPRNLDVPDAKLLGDRQLKFLRHWAADWKGAEMKVAISQTILACATTQSMEQPFPRPGEYPRGRPKSVDLDSNGWPQSGRNRALRELRRGFAFTIAGDQHLGTIIHHGIDDHEDAGYSFCVPAIANVAPRSWYPSEPGGDHRPGLPPYTGRYLDGFGNRITVWAASNPMQTGREPASLHDRATGYGIVRFDKRQQRITMECWPRYSDPSAPGAVQFPGWPKTISLQDNYARRAEAWLPQLQFLGIDRPVVQVIDESDGQIVYTLRVNSSTFQPMVFREGAYTVKVGEPGTSAIRTLRGVEAAGSEIPRNTLQVDFR